MVFFGNGREVPRTRRRAIAAGCRFTSAGSALRPTRVVRYRAGRSILMVALRVPSGVIPNPWSSCAGGTSRGGFHAWVVGGLRDILLERAPKDWDLATSATPAQMQRLFKRVIPTGIEHGTVTVLLRGGSYEITTLRGEGAYTDSRRPDSVVFIDDIERDLARRDFTVNALAYDPLTDALIDPFGGIADMQRRTLRTVGRAQERFGEDGLRVLRAARFAATLEFDLEPETRAAIPSALDAFRRVSPERVRDEWLRTLDARQPSRAFDVMLSTGILGVTVPDLVEQVDCAQNRYHAYDVWRHSLSAWTRATAARCIAWPGCCTTWASRARARYPTRPATTPSTTTRLVGARMADQWLKHYRFSNDERERVVHLVRHHLVCYSDEWTDAAVRRFVQRVGLDRLDDLLDLARADVLGQRSRRARRDSTRSSGCAPASSRHSPRAQHLGSKIGGRRRRRDQRLAIPPSRRVGKVLEELLQRVLDQSRAERTRCVAARDR